eukprot:5811072-Pyramimonas_sp.AAC.1
MFQPTLALITRKNLEHPRKYRNWRVLTRRALGDTRPTLLWHWFDPLSTLFRVLDIILGM